ncbi:SIR2 family protein [Mesorhizobium sp. B2-3-15]|uniref:SIR2 family protein n=2 Tax=unclassified Mesorhizobium TaxID=325217 RepID=UPI001AEE79EC|nr:SIR2 family protein [Mesorhizobium sp. B2-3-15]
MSLEDDLTKLFKAKAAGPFLFVGSGFSRRYLGLEDWSGLLRRFCRGEQPFEFYLASADGDLPLAAKLIAEQFNEFWWTAEEFKESVSKNKSKIKGITSALRIEISNYLLKLDQNTAKKSEYEAEVKLLSSLNVDGIITTNWDPFLEQVFPDYKIYVGQEELLFSNPQEIGEIYKIHGCASRPESLTLTSDDYHDFNNKNAYLAAKLITIFVEHPVVFIGYSISDQNISMMLRSISLCIGKENVEKLRRNLIFVQRSNGTEKDSISDTYISIDGVQIPLVLVKTNDFTQIYRSLESTKRKIPARVLRYCKEQLYELVKSSEPEKKICVVDIDEIDRKEDVEFLVGVGVVSQQQVPISGIGYAGIDARDLISDLLFEDRGYDPKQVIEQSIKIAGRNTKNVPVFKYLHACGTRTRGEYSKSGYNLDKWVNRPPKDFKLGMYAKSFLSKYRSFKLEEI